MTAFTESARRVTLTTGADLSGAAINSLLVINNAGKVILATNGTATPVGTIAMKPEAGADQAISVNMLHGIVPMIAAQAINAGQVVVGNADAGKIEGANEPSALSADENGVGVALEAAANDGDQIPVLCGYYPKPNSA